MDKILSKDIDELNSLLVREYKSAVLKVYGLLVEMYMKITVDDKPLISALYSYNRYYNLLKEINIILDKLGAKEEQLFTEHLEKMYVDTSNKINKQFEFTTKIDEDKVKEIIQTPWIGEDNYSDRIWKNKGELVRKIKHNLIQSVIAGQSPETFSSNLSDNLLKNGYFPIKRLMITEMNRMHLQATVDRYKELGITRVKVITANDNKVCDECKDNSTKEYSVDEILSILPTHPLCRCSIVALI